MKFKLKDEKEHSKAVVHLRKSKDQKTPRVVLGKATQAQLGVLFKMKHPFVIEDKGTAK